MPIREALGTKQIHWEMRKMRSVPSSGGGIISHSLLNDVVHNDTETASPVEGALILANSTPTWDILLHPVDAGHALVTDGTTWTIDQTPTWTGRHSWDDGGGVTAYIDEDGSADFNGHVAIGDLATVNAAYALNLQEEFTDLSGTVAGLRFQVRHTPAAGSSATVYGALGQVQVNAAQAYTGSHVGVFGQVIANNTIAATGLDLVGIQGRVDVEDAAAGTATGGLFATPLVDTGSATTGYGVRITEGTVGAGSITTLYGLRVESITAGNTNWAGYFAGGNVSLAAGNLFFASTYGIDHADDANGDYLRLSGGLYVPGNIQVSDVPGLDAQFLTLALDGDLPNERVFVDGAGLVGTDGGAGGNYTLNIGAGDGITVNANDVALTTPGTLSVSSVNTSVGSHTHQITSSSNPGAAESIIASAADGGVQLIRFGIGIDGNADNLLRIVDGGAVGLSSATGRLVFNATGTDAIEVTTADLEIATSGYGITHADGNTSGYVLLGNGTRYIPAAANANVPIAPGARGHIIRAQAGPVWASYNAATNGAVLIGDGTDIISDTTPTIAGLVTFSGGWINAGGTGDLDGTDLIIDADGDSYLHESADDVVDLVLATATGEFGININGADDFTFTANSLNVASGSFVTMADDTGIGIGAAAGRITFDDQATDQVEIQDAILIVGGATTDSNFTAQTYHIDGDVGISYNGEPAIYHAFSYGADAGDFAIFRGRRSRGTRGSETAVLDGDIFIRVGGAGHDGTSFPAASTGRLQIQAAENWTATARGTNVDIWTTPNTTTTPAQIARFSQAGHLKVGSAGGPSGVLHADQNSASGIPNLYLEQDDVDMEFAHFIGTANAGSLDRSIVDYGDEATSTAAVWLKIRVTDDGNQVTDRTYHVLAYVLA